MHQRMTREPLPSLRTKYVCVCGLTLLCPFQTRGGGVALPSPIPEGGLSLGSQGTSETSRDAAHVPDTPSHLSRPSSRNQLQTVCCSLPFCIVSRHDPVKALDMTDIWGCL